MDNKSTTKRMIGAVVLVLVAALLLAWLLKGKNPKLQQDQLASSSQSQTAQPIAGFPGVADNSQLLPPPLAPTTPPALVSDTQNQTSTESQQAETANQAVTNEVTPPSDNMATFEIRPGEVRSVVDPNTPAPVASAEGSVGSGSGAVVETSATEPAKMTEAEMASAANEAGSMAAEAVSAAATAGAGAVATVTATAAKEVLVSKPATPNREPRPVTITATKPPAASQPRIVNERPVPAMANNRERSQSVTTKAPATNAPKAVASTNTNPSAVVARTPSVDATTTGAISREGYVIQVLATADKGKADTLRRTIVTDGYPAFIAQGQVNGKQVYRVRIGTFKAKSDAVSVQSRMKTRYTQNQLVQNSFVTNNK